MAGPALKGTQRTYTQVPVLRRHVDRIDGVDADTLLRPSYVRTTTDLFSFVDFDNTTVWQIKTVDLTLTITPTCMDHATATRGHRIWGRSGQFYYPSCL